MYLYADISAGVGTYFGSGVDSAKSIFFGAMADAGFYINLANSFCLDIAATASYLDKGIYYGANIGFIFIF